MSTQTPRSVHIETVRKSYKGKTYVSHLLRRSYREGSKVKHETLGTLNDLPADLIAVMRERLASGQPIACSSDSIAVLRSTPHGHVAAVLETMQTLGFEKLISSTATRERSLVLAMIADRILSPGSKLSCCRGLDPNSQHDTLCDELKLGDVEVRELYEAMDWLLGRQNRIENKLARRHLQDGSLVLFDVSSRLCTGSKSDLNQHGHSRDHRSDLPQIVYGLLCDSEGRPISVEVFPGNTADPNTFKSVVQRVRSRFGIGRVVFVGDRGMITSKRIDEDLRNVDGAHWITAIRTEGLRSLKQKGHIPRSLFDDVDLAEVRDEELYPGERVVICKNPFLADERARKREELLRATEKHLQVIVKATARSRNPLRGADAIGIRVGKVINKYKMAKHFQLSITDTSFEWVRLQENIDAEASLDGLYAVRSNVPKEEMDESQLVSSYKQLSRAERAFRSMKSVDLKVRPIHHWTDDRIRSHVFICMLAYYVEWHMRRQLRELLFDDQHVAEAQKERSSVVVPAVRSRQAKAKDASKQTQSGLPVQSFQDLLKVLATQCRVSYQLTTSKAQFHQLTELTALQRRAFELLRSTPVALDGESVCDPATVSEV